MNCPNFHGFWAERDRLNGIFEDHDGNNFQRAQRPLTREETRSYPGLVVITKHGIETILPGVDYASLKDITYRKFVRDILEANFPTRVSLSDMQLIWDALVNVIFGFECSCLKERKASEVGTHEVKGSFRYVDC